MDELLNAEFKEAFDEFDKVFYSLVLLHFYCRQFSQQKYIAKEILVLSLISISSTETPFLSFLFLTKGALALWGPIPTEC